jgi:hypothetical protein
LLFQLIGSAPCGAIFTSHHKQTCIAGGVFELRVLALIPSTWDPPAIIEPLPIAGAKSFDPFAYGDHLWAAMSKFPNFAGVADLRVPRGIPRPTL